MRRQLLKELLLLIAVALLIVSTVAQDLVIPLWLHSFGKGGPYFVLLVSSVFFVLFFGCGFLALRFVLYPEIRKKGGAYQPSFRKNAWNCFVIGFLDAVNGVLIIYASEPIHTPPVLQPVLGSSAILWSIVFSKLLVMKHREFGNRWVFLCIFLVCAGLVVMLAPTVVQSGGLSMDLNQGMWVLVFLLGVIPGALYNVMEQKALMSLQEQRQVHLSTRENTESSKLLPPTAHEDAREAYFRNIDLWFVLAVSVIFQLLVIVALCWVNYLPWFGIGELGIMDSAKCFFGINQECNHSWWLGLCFIAAYILSYFATILVNESSANYNEFVGSLIAPLSVAFWYVFPDVIEYESPDLPPIWAALLSLVLLTCAAACWRLWEKREEQNELNKELN